MWYSEQIIDLFCAYRILCERNVRVGGSFCLVRLDLLNGPFVCRAIDASVERMLLLPR